MPTLHEKRAILEIARTSIVRPARARWSAQDWRKSGVPVEGTLLEHPRGVFVTLRDPSGELRGCIGTIRAAGALYSVVAAFAVAAAYEDPRFPPVEPQEIAGLRLHVSILSPDREIHGPADIRLGIDGVSIRHPEGAGLFLPEVATETGWDAETFLGQVCRKGGLARDSWRDPESSLFAFETFSFGEDDSRALSSTDVSAARS